MSSSGDDDVPRAENIPEAGDGESRDPPSPSSKKSRLGQFYSARWVDLLDGLSVPRGLVVVEPFVGAGDLLRACPDGATLELYDIDPPPGGAGGTVRRDTIADPPDYGGRFVLTNPPYLARNKSADKAPYDRYGLNDLYKCFVAELTAQDAAGGILVLPVNFWSGVRRADVALRARFLRKYRVVRLNVFDGRMFPDTTAAVCAFQFAARGPPPAAGAAPRRDDDVVSLEVWCYPEATAAAKTGRPLPPTRHVWDLRVAPDGMAMPGGHVHRRALRAAATGDVRVERLTRDNDTPANEPYKCDLVLHAVDGKGGDDDGSRRIRLEVVRPGARVVDRTPRLSGRSSASFLVRPPLDAATQRALCTRFNAYLEEQRAAYHSLFLPAFREFTRKRIPFSLAFRLIASFVSEGAWISITP